MDRTVEVSQLGKAEVFENLMEKKKDLTSSLRTERYLSNIDWRLGKLTTTSRRRIENIALREKCPNTKFFLVRIFLHSVQTQENTIRKNSLFGHFSRSVV